MTLEEDGQTACFWSDIVPTKNHVHRPFIMAYDMNAALSYEVRGPWIERATDEGWICMLLSRPGPPAGEICAGRQENHFSASLTGGST